MTEEDTTAARPLRVLFVAAEADPLIKVGGLGDVTGTLPNIIRELPPTAVEVEVDIRLVIPFHAAIRKRIDQPELVATFPVPHPQGPVTAQAYRTWVGTLPVYLIAGAPIPEDAADPIYHIDTRQDGEKFTFFSLAVLELARALNWPPDILHANDWHTALSVYMLHRMRTRDRFFRNTHALLTIHNLPYMGYGIADAMQAYGIPPLGNTHLKHFPRWGRYQPLPMGLATADFITAVSPTYAQEMMTPAFGCGLEDFLQTRSGSIQGILNGLDQETWDPAVDPALAAHFTAQTLTQRTENKRALLKTFDLPVTDDVPLLVMIGRMDQQKGVDLALAGLRQIIHQPWQAILLGTGDPILESAARQLESDFPNRIRAAIRFDARLSRQMYAGGDMLLMPSRYEPCGLAQMIAMRYGCLPVARATGGLRDTIQDPPDGHAGTGFLFEEASAEALAEAIQRGVAAYAQPRSWQARQRLAMQQDFSWQRSAQAYRKIYQQLFTS